MAESVSPPGICLLFPLFSLLQQTMDDYVSFASDTSKWEQVNMATWGSLDICPLLTQFQVVEITRVGLSAISHTKAWGDPKRTKSDMAYLLLLPNQVVDKKRRFGLVAVWTQPLPSSSTFTGWSGKKTYLTDQYWRGLDLCLHAWHTQQECMWAS